MGIDAHEASVEALCQWVDLNRMNVAIDCAEPIAIALEHLAQAFGHLLELGVQALAEDQGAASPSRNGPR